MARWLAIQLFAFAHVTFITPTKIMMTLGQNVKKASNPGPIGFGFGSLVRPSDAARMMATSGPVPSTSSQAP